MKTCFKCNQQKAETEFYHHPRMADGRLGKCKSCTKQDVRQNYKEKREQYAEYYREREKTESRKACKREMQRRSRRNNPQKAFARQTIGNAIRDGRIIRQPCQICGSKDSEAHHTDYSKPLDVQWLCFAHHRMAHGQTPIQQPHTECT